MMALKHLAGTQDDHDQSSHGRHQSAEVSDAGWSSNLHKSKLTPFWDLIEGGEILDFSLYDTADNVNNATRKLYASWHKSLSDEEISALGNYVADGHALNNYIRYGGQWHNSTTTEIYDNRIEHLDAAIEKTSIPERVVVYRYFGDSFNPEILEVGNVIEDSGFVSTTLWPHGLKYNIGSVEKAIEIRIPKGAKGAFMVFPGIGRSEESEILLPRDSRFRVIESGEKPVLELIK